MAAPFVTGAAALLLAANSNLSAAQIKNAIINGADTISITVPASNCSGKENQSVLKLNIYNAIRRVAFKVDSSGEKIVGTWFNINSNIVIPDIINGTTITTIGAEAFKGCSNLSSITIPSAVTSIESSAFEDCCSLVSVNLSKDLKSIGSSAFKGCSDLSSITIPNRVKNIDSSAFEDCHSLTSVILSRDLTCIESSAFKGCSDLSSITMYNRVTSIGLSAFENCSNLQSINLSSDLTSIGDSAFKGCTNLNSIVVPDSVTSIGYGAFLGCTNLTTITLPFVGGLEEDDNTNYFGYIFGAQTYYENSNYVPSVLKNVILTGSTKIGISAFRSCVNLEHITLPNTITTIETNAFFDCSNLESITIPNSVTSIGDSAFLRCESLSSIEIPNSVTNINSSVFYKCTNLQSVILSSNLINIGYAAFLGCESLNNVVVPNSVTSIEGYAFYGCSNLENIIIPNNVTSIEIFAFGKCTNLKNITLPFIGGKEVDGYRSHFGYIFGASISDENGIYVPSSLKEVILTGGVKIGISAFQNCANLKHITLPNTITDIKANAFYGCSNLEDIIIPDSITNIGSVAFKECTSLVSITIPDSVTNIGDGAFENCFNLENVIIQREISKITNLGENAFDGCKSTLQIVVPMDRVAEYKNKVYWSKYASKIVSNFLEFPELDLNCVSNFTNVTMLLSGYNKIYKLNVECAKTYKITSTSSYGIKMRLYNSSMVLMESSTDIIDQYLGKGTYYIDLEFLSNTSSGTINTTYELKWANDGEILRYNKDNNALKHLHKTDSNLYRNEMFYSNTRGAGFYKFILTATRFDGKSVYYPKGAITIYSDKERTTIIDKFCLSEYSDLAQTSQDQNNMIVYLPLNGNYYIDVSMTTDELESLYLKITYVDSQELDLFNLSEMGNEQVSIISETIKGDYIKSLNVEQAGKFTISALYDGNSNNDILFVVAKLIYNSSMNTYSLQTKFTTIMNDSNDTYTSTFSLDKGTYFVGYFNKDDTKAFNVSFNRLVTQYGSSVLIPDPNSSSVGSQVGVYEKDLKVTERSYRGTTIVTGFTRVIYLDSHFVNNTSRKDYYWYSNNTNVASVSEYGTVFGKSKGDVKIMAVNKNNPSIVFVKSFTVIDDPNTSSETIIVPIYATHNINKGDYQIGLTVQNCPYPSVQYYTWSIDYKDDTITSVKIDAWGKVKIEGTGEIIIKGTDYLYNDKYIVEIHLTVIDE